MKKIAFLLVFSASLAGITALGQTSSDYTRYVDPFVGTGGHGHTFPGAVLPFGMVQLSPDTRGADWDGSSGYHYSDDIIYGFSHTHLSGTGIPDGCDILFMPMVGEPKFFAKPGDKSVNGYASKFSHANEKAEPGYYSVKLDDDGILAEMTATKRVGLHRYTFDSSGHAALIVDLAWRDKLLDGELTIRRNRIEGFRRSSSWAKDQTVYFAAEFSLPVKNSKFGPEVIGVRDGKIVLSKLKPVQASLGFEVKPGQPLLVKVSISSVSIEGARRNLTAELSGWNFDKVRAAAKAAWNKELSKIEVTGGTPGQVTTFYTALYHTMIHPSLFNDVDGNYRGLDGKIHNIADGLNVISPHVHNGTTPPKGRVKPLATAGGSDQYSVFSLWDTFRAAHPLYTIIDQKHTVDFINTFIRMYEQGGRLPVWELWGNETDTMIGYHAVSVIADAMAKGIKGFDYVKAYEASKNSARMDHFGLAAYKKRGYISMEDENESVSKTLEYAYDDACIAWMTYLMTHDGFEAGGRPNEDLFRKYSPDYVEFGRRARSFENLYDPTSRFMRPRKNGGFVSPFAPNEVTFNYTEGNAWQYTFFVPQDPGRLSQLLGGQDRLAAALDELFTTSEKLSGREQPDITGLIGQYAHGNEPSHHIAYLYNYAGQPWKTQRIVRRILDEFYKPTPDGLIGNEDCGQMSAWYVLSASGFYPVAPGYAAYALGTPLFKQVKFHLENGKTFTINAPNVSSKNIYVKAAYYDGKRLVSPHIAHAWISRGVVVDLEMSPTPARDAFDRFIMPVSAGLLTPVPVIEAADRVFIDKTTVTISAVTPQLEKQIRIHYTTDGSEPGDRSPMYTAPFTIERTSTIKAISIPIHNPAPFYRSEVSEARYTKKPNDWTVKIASPYSNQYTGGGDEGLIDGIRGTRNFASGEWQGYQGKDFVATIDLQKETDIRSIGGGFLQNARSWIWMPTHVEFEVSSDGVNFTKVADIKTDVPITEMEPTNRDYSTDIPPVKARFVRAHAYNLGKIPSWHPGAGGDPWIFVDEVFVK